VSRLSLSGSMVALVTPMTNSGEVDYTDLDNLIDFHLANNTDGIVVLGTTGESVTLTDNEKEKIVCRVVDKIGGNIPVIVGTGHNSTAVTIRQTQKAKEWGADAALIVTPYYNKPTQEGLLAHYKAITNAVDIPIVLYNVPGRTACDMLPETTAKLALEPNIIGIKEASNEPSRITSLVNVCPKEFSLLSGDDETILHFLSSGGHGIISVTANIVPSKMSAICAAVKNNNLALAEKTNSSLLDLHSKLFIRSNPIPVKWALYYAGLISSDNCRLPLLPLETQYHAELTSALEQAEVAEVTEAFKVV
jgi:4-hydroxy-tetrahydrodipicolinate synthase